VPELPTLVAAPGGAAFIIRWSQSGGGILVDRNRPARYGVGDRAALKATGQPVEILEVRRGEFVPDFVYKVRVLAERPARPYNLSVPEHDLKDS
jgi:hypothetical protein